VAYTTGTPAAWQRPIALAHAGTVAAAEGMQMGEAGEMKPPCISIIINAYFFMTVPFKFLFYTIIAQIEKYFNCQKRRSICFVVFV